MKIKIIFKSIIVEMSFLLTATDILKANLLNDSGEESDFVGAEDELEDHEEDEIEYEYDNNNEKNYSDITLTSFVPSIDIHIENYNEILFTPTFLTDINHPIDSHFIEGVQDFEEYAQTINSSVVQSNLINNFIRYDNFELPALESNMIRSQTFQIPLVNLIW